MGCILSIVTCLCDPLKAAFGSSAQAQAENAFSSLGDLAGRAVLDLVREWRNKVIRQQTDATTLVGAEESLKAIRSHLLGNEVNVVGIVGMGGVGKTTLLKKINNDFYSGGAGNFNIVIFVTVSREGDASRVREKIAERLGLPKQTDSGAIFGVLEGKRYLLLLDDVWGKKLDLSEIGVPFPNKENECKIALTTRSADDFESFLGTWCRPRSERARVVNVRKLDKARSWELFRSMVDHPNVNLDDPYIAPHAEKMVQKCDGLPLALVIVGKAMATATSAAKWKEAKRQWEESPYNLEGMDQVKSNLMFSIDRLKEQGTLLPCFLYCSLFSEDYNIGEIGEIGEKELIEYWIGEGFFDEGVYSSLDSTRDKGEIEIQKLKDLCLLETGTIRGSVKMHDLVREVALDLAKLEPYRFVVHAFDFSFRQPKPIINIANDEWEKATRVSLMNCEIKEGSLPKMPCCPKLSTLLMFRVKHSKDIFDKLYTSMPNSMPNLVVLDLSYSLDSHTMPTSICLLSGLRFLSLRGTRIRSLPEELGSLVKLRQLDLSQTGLKEIPQQAILGLSNLQMLNMLRCGYTWGLEGENNIDAADNNGDKQLRVSDLYGMNQLQDFGIDIFRRLDILGALLHNRGDSLLTSITGLFLSDVDYLTTDILHSVLQRMTSLRQLAIVDCDDLTDELILDDNAHKPMLSELEVLELRSAPLSAILINMTDGINEEGGENSGYERPRRQWGGPLQKLKRLYLACLPNLQRICVNPPQKECLPSLEYLVVYLCPLLRTLPQGPHSTILHVY